MKQRFFILFLLFCMQISCTKEIDTIGNYFVSIQIYTNSVDKELRSIYDYKAFKHSNTKPNPSVQGIGYGGVLVVHDTDNELYAFDLSCPYEASPSVLIEVIDSSKTAICPQCKTEYNIFDQGFGSRIKGAGKEPLKKYLTTRVYNKLYDWIVTNPKY